MARVVWLSGFSAAGKTFTGDYLARVAGFHHLDGDSCFFSSDPKEQEMFKHLIKAFDFWFEGKAAPDDLWQPYYLFQIQRIHAATSEGRDIVLSHTVYHRQARDFIRKHMPQHIFVLLVCSKEELNRRAKIRFAKYAETLKKTMEECYEDQNKEPYSDEAFEKRTVSLMRGLQPIEPDERLCYTIDVTDCQPWQQLHAILELPPPPEHIPVDEIAAQNYARFQAHAPKEE